MSNLQNTSPHLQSSERGLDEVTRVIIEKMKQSSRKESLVKLKKIGIATENGELAPEYAGLAVLGEQS